MKVLIQFAEQAAAEFTEVSDVGGSHGATNGQNMGQPVAMAYFRFLPPPVFLRRTGLMGVSSNRAV